MNSTIARPFLRPSYLTFLVLKPILLPSNQVVLLQHLLLNQEYAAKSSSKYQEALSFQPHLKPSDQLHLQLPGKSIPFQKSLDS